MPLSTEKLVKLLYNKNFIIRTYYKLYGVCAFVEIFSQDTMSSYMMYIPSKYEFEIPDDIENVYDLKVINIDKFNDSEVSDEYAGSPDIDKLEKTYEEVNIEDDYNIGDNIISKLEEKYKQPIQLREEFSTSKNIIKSLYRQLNRLKFCVSNLKYKLSIFYKNYFCVLHIDDTIECFSIEDYVKNNSYFQILVQIDLELFYENMKTITNDLVQVKSGVQKILDKNHQNHTLIIQNMLEKKSDINQLSNSLFNKKNIYRQYIEQYTNLLQKTIDLEQEKIQQLENLKAQRGQNLYDDINYSHYKKRIELEYEKIHNTKSNIIDKLIEWRSKEEHTSLIIDKILFDNAIMMDKVLQNLSYLDSIQNI
jgi:hypothetical protein